MLERGFLLPTCRYIDSDLLGDFSVFCPPFVISEQQICDAVDALRDTIEQLMPGWEERGARSDRTTRSLAHFGSGAPALLAGQTDFSPVVTHGSLRRRFLNHLWS